VEKEKNINYHYKYLKNYLLSNIIMNYTLYKQKLKDEKHQNKINQFEEKLREEIIYEKCKKIYVICFNNKNVNLSIFNEIDNLLNFLDNKYVVIVSTSKNIGHLTNIRLNTKEFREIWKYYIQNYNICCEISTENIEELKNDISLGIDNFNFIQKYEKVIIFIV